MSAFRKNKNKVLVLLVLSKLCFYPLGYCRPAMPNMSTLTLVDYLFLMSLLMT